MLKNILQNFKQITFLSVLLIIFVTPGLTAKPYVSLNGQFVIEYPDDWEQIDFNTVDVFLARSKVGEKQYDYDAVLAPSLSSPFFSGPYLILKLDTSGELDKKQIDSMLQMMLVSFGKGLRYFPVSDHMADLRTDYPNYDKKNKIMSVLSTVTKKSESYKKSLLMHKLYEKGVASFYFFAPDSIFEASLPIFEKIISSFSTENIEASLPKEKLKIADLDSNDGKKKGFGGIPIAIVISLVVVLFFVIRKKLKKRQQ